MNGSGHPAEGRWPGPPRGPADRMAAMSGLRGSGRTGPIRRPPPRGGPGGRGALGVVDYTLAKRALLREFKSGLLSRLEICDAHPELIRAARYMGAEARRPCPVCEGYELRLLAYVYADGLRQDSGRPHSIPEALSLAAAHAGGKAYVVEVCTGCNWNHLSESFSARSVG